MRMSASMKSMPGVSGQSIVRPFPLENPHLSRSSLVLRASKENVSAEKVAASTVGLAAAACLVPQFASAAQEVFQIAEGEPLVVQAGWAALAASFTMSIAIVVWGRSGL